MTETMIARMARAMRDRHRRMTPRELGGPYYELARAALEAMREPTDRMMDGAWGAMPAKVTEVSDRHLQEAFTAAIDAALSEDAKEE